MHALTVLTVVVHDTHLMLHTHMHARTLLTVVMLHTHMHARTLLTVVARSASRIAHVASCSTVAPSVRKENNAIQQSLHL